MEDKLQKLAEKLYSDGIEKAKKEAESILGEANKKADQILNDARNKEKEIVEKATREVEELKKRVLIELKSAVEQTKLSLKQELVNLIASNVFKEDISEVLNDKNLIKELLVEICKKWDISKGAPDLEIILPEKKKKELENVFKKELKTLLDKGLTVSFEGRMENGFQVISKNENFILSFTDEDFNQFFASYLKPKTKELLFSGEK